MRLRDRLYWEMRYLRAPRWDVPLFEQLCAALDQEAARHVRGRALDVGCGSGRVATHLARKGIRVTALDVSAVALARARVRALRAGVSLSFHRGDVLESDLPVVAGPYDMAVDVGFFHALAPAARQRYATRLLQLLGSESSMVLIGLRPGVDGRVAGIADSDLERWLPELRVESNQELSSGKGGVLCVLRRA